MYAYIPLSLQYYPDVNTLFLNKRNCIIFNICRFLFLTDILVFNISILDPNVLYLSNTMFTKSHDCKILKTI